MKILIYCAIVNLIVLFVLDVCGATCEEYTIIFEENTCPRYRIKPLTHDEILNWIGKNDDCNTSEIYNEIYNENKECLLEFQCLNNYISCLEHVIPKNIQSHAVIPDNHGTRKVIRGNLNNNTSYVNNNSTLPNTTLNEEDETSMFNVHLIYNNVNAALDVSSIKNKKMKMHDKVICQYVEIVCNNAEKKPSIPFGSTDSYFHNASTVFLDISIDRDETSPLQPIFTGYFPELSKEALSSYENDFQYLKTASLKCPILKNDTSKCETNKSVNVYINTNYIENNTNTNYPNCTMDTDIHDNIFHLICDNVTFEINNKHLKFSSKPVPISDSKQDLLSWSCEVMESKDLLTSKTPDIEVSDIYFKNCIKDLNNNNTTNDKNNIKSSITDLLKKENTTNITTPKLIKIIMNENGNCTQNTILNLRQGKFINFGINKQNVLKNDEIEINLSDCIKVKNSTFNDTDKLPYKNLEMIISLQNESLKASDLKLMNGDPKETNETERLFLRCDHSNNFHNNTIKNITVLQCETIDAKDLIILENNSEQDTILDDQAWNCQIIEYKDSVPSKENIKETYFKDCFKGKEKNEHTSSKPDILNNDNTTDVDPKKFIKIIVNENANCTQNTTLNIQYGKFVDFEVTNDKQNIFENDIVEINIADCIKVNDSITNSSDKLHQAKVEMTIFLKNKSLNASDMKLLNKSPKQKETYERDRLSLRCGSSNVTNSKTTKSSKTFECENIELKDLITLEDSTDVNQNTTKDAATDDDNKNLIKNVDSKKTIPNNKNKDTSINDTRQHDKGWNCKIVEFKDSLPTREKIKETYFKDCFKGNSKEINELTTSKPDLLKKDNITDVNPKKIKIIVNENANCTENTTLNIQHGKFVDFEVTNDKQNILENDIVEINLSNCIKANDSITNSSDKQHQAKVEMTIFLKNESLNASDMQLLNKSPKQKETDERNRLFLRCGSPNTKSSKTLECENIELKDVITLEDSTDVNQNTTATEDDNKNLKKNVDGNKTVPNNKNKETGIKDKREVQNTITFNRKKDVNKLGKQENLVGDLEVEGIILITIAAIAGTSTLLVLALRFCRKQEHDYSPTAPREPGVDEETAF